MLTLLRTARLLIVVLASSPAFWRCVAAAASSTTVRWTLENDECERGFFLEKHDDESSGNTTTTKQVPPPSSPSSSASILVRRADWTLCLPSKGLSVSNDIVPALQQPPPPQRASAGATLVPNDPSWWTSLLDENGAGSLELWMQPAPYTGRIADAAAAANDTTNTEWQTIVAIQDTGIASSSSLALTVCDQLGIHFALRQRHNQIEVVFRTSDPVFEPCAHMMVSIMDGLFPPAPKFAHVVVSLQDGRQRLLVNGGIAVDERTERWDGDALLTNRTAQLQVFPVFDESTSPWSGVLYEMAIHARATNVTEALELLQAGMTPSRPFAERHNVVVMYEDAEPIPNSHTLEWYSRPTAVWDADVQTLPVRSLDRELMQWLGSLVGVVSEAAASGAAVHSFPLYWYITRLPDTGQLFLSNGAQIESLDENDNGNRTHLSSPFPIPNGGVIFLPPHNAHSEISNLTESGLLPLTSLDYCVTSVPIFALDNCLSVTLNVIVMPVNDPPLALGSRDPIVVVEGAQLGEGPKIMLTGLDVDAGNSTRSNVTNKQDGIRRVRITRPPEYGELHLVVGRFRADGLIHGTIMRDVGYTMNLLESDEEAIFVEYIFDQALYPHVVQSNVVADSFEFAVADATDSWSDTETLFITVEPCIVAIPAADVAVTEDDTTGVKFQLTGTATHFIEGRTVEFWIESAPDAGAGRLIDPTNGQTLSPGSMLSPTAAMNEMFSRDLMFVPALDFCSDSGTPASFTFRALSMSEQVKSASDLATQNISVQCIPDLLEWSAPLETLHVTRYALRDKGRLQRDCGSPGCTSAALINGVELTVKDTNKNDATIVIACQEGFLRFRSTGWAWARPAFEAENNLDQRGKLLTLAALPNDIPHVLASIMYEPAPMGSDDSLTIKIVYGNCTNHDGNTTRPGCQVIHNSFDILVATDPDSQVYSTELVSRFPWQILVGLILFPSLYIAYMRRGRGSWKMHWIYPLRSRDDSGSNPAAVVAYEDDAETVADDEEGAANCDSHIVDVECETGATHVEEKEEPSNTQAPEWVEYCAEDGTYYYENKVDGRITWMAPVGMEVTDSHAM